MKVIHIICRMDEKTNRPLGISPIDVKTNRYMSCCWDFDIEEMEQLIGGMIFFHRTKTQKSYLGGVVHKVHPIDMNQSYDGPYYTPNKDDVGKRSDRIMFEFEITKEAREPTNWRGSKHSMSYYSGVVDTEEIV